MIGTWTARNSATRPSADQNCGSLQRLRVVVEADERGAADQLVAEQAQVDRVADRGEEDQREDRQERGRRTASRSRTAGVWRGGAFVRRAAAGASVLS